MSTTFIKYTLSLTFEFNNVLIENIQNKVNEKIKKDK